MSDSAELSVATNLSSGGKACWKPKVMRNGQHYTPPTAAHTLCCVKPLIFFFPRSYRRRSSRTLVGLSSWCNERAVSMMNCSPYHCHQYLLSPFSSIYSRIFSSLWSRWLTWWGDSNPFLMSLSPWSSPLCRLWLQNLSISHQNQGMGYQEILT